MSSFGGSGTNVHVILEEAPAFAAQDAQAAQPTLLPLVISGRTEAALRAQAGQLAGFLREHGGDLNALAGALARRSAFAHRAVVFGSDDLSARLAALAAGTADCAVVRGSCAGRVGEGAGRLLFPWSRRR